MSDRTSPDTYRYSKSGPVEPYLDDARQVLAAMPDGSVDAIATSPPFWSLRDYGTDAWHDGTPACPHPLPAGQRRDGASCRWRGATWADPQYRLEPTVGEYVDRLVRAFDEAMRVLKPAGALWLKLGDIYTGSTRRVYDTAGGFTGTPGWWLFSGSRRSPGRLDLRVSAAQWLIADPFGLQRVWCEHGGRVSRSSLGRDDRSSQRTCRLTGPRP
ncbi:DNA methyltransferase [Micromonospora carbonacea]|uniref:DNA methyltransferase n=1 Tax=Micromonospora carbonacea TaxID=47853 RepID=UPI00159F2AC3|nr:DNA methyltransferase [Micromonospora carbonacea]